MSYPINYPTPQGANVQIFQAPRLFSSSPNNHQNNTSWVKPQGASFVFFTLIGAGGGGGGFNGADLGGGGGSAAVTNFMCPAFLIPDQLTVLVGRGGAGGTSGGNGATGTESSIYYDVKAKESYILLTALGGAFGSSGSTPGAGGAAMSANYFTASGFLSSTSGSAGDSGSGTPTTFLQGGAGGTGSSPIYGYGVSDSKSNGFVLMQPIIVGTGGQARTIGSGATLTAGVGCGGGGGYNIDANGSRGGDGLVVIVTW